MELEDLKRGMRCTFRKGDTFIFDYSDGNKLHYLGEGSSGSYHIERVNNDLTCDGQEYLDIVKVEDITLDGFETIWERKELFYLKNPLTEQYLNFVISRSGYIEDDNNQSNYYQTQFTRTEIDNMPFQEIIKVYKQVPVKEGE